MKPKTHSEHNYEVYEFLLSDGRFYDWVVTTAFYSALHLVQEEIFPFSDDEGYTYSSFEQYFSKSLKEGQKISKHQFTIKLVEQRIKGAVNLYRSLHDMNSFKLFQFAKKLLFPALFLSSFPSVVLPCNSKNPSTALKTSNFRLNPKSLNEFYGVHNILSRNSYF
ncbi:MAG: hypothetical protein GKR88_10675 [Flavobacteriaceae bacterium]|nr:MAG: hypothetical protein GKR88_10675 [Flavobacteriaceae bacterium]